MDRTEFHSRILTLWSDSGASPEIAHARADEAAETYARDQRLREPPHRRIVRLAAQMVYEEGDVVAARVASYAKYAGIAEEDMPGNELDWLALGAALGNAWAQLDEKQRAAVDAGAVWGTAPAPPSASPALNSRLAGLTTTPSWSGLPMVDGVHAIIPQGVNGVGFIGGMPVYPEPPSVPARMNPVPSVAPPMPSPAIAPAAISGATNPVPGPCSPAPPPVPVGMGATGGGWDTPMLNHVPAVAPPSADALGPILEPADPVFMYARSIVGRENPMPGRPATAVPLIDADLEGAAVQCLHNKVMRSFKTANPDVVFDALALARFTDAIADAAKGLAGGAAGVTVHVPFFAMRDDDAPVHLTHYVTAADLLPPPPPLAEQVRETVRAAREEMAAELAARDAKIASFRAVLDAVAEGISTDRVTAKWLVQGSRQDLIFHPHGTTTTRHATHVTVTHDGVLVHGHWLETTEAIVGHFKTLCSSIDFLGDLKEAEALAIVPETAAAGTTLMRDDAPV